MSEAQTVSLSVSVVVFKTPIDYVLMTLESAIASITYAREQELLSGVVLQIIDNSVDFEYTSEIQSVIDHLHLPDFCTVTLEQNKKNNGFGAAHNQAIIDTNSDIHLVLNPDVELSRSALYRGISTLINDTSLLLVGPSAVCSEGKPLYLSKRYPSLFVLGLRGFGGKFIKNTFSKVLDKYEMRDVIMRNETTRAPLVSGCFMLCKTDRLQLVGGFNERFFMYFEDFDLSLRLGVIGEVAIDPNVKIVHHGGNVSAKGLKHLWFFARSCIAFFNEHGWRFI